MTRRRGHAGETWFPARPRAVGERCSRWGFHVFPPPRLDPAVIAREEDLRDLPATKLGRARVVRILESAVQRRREALDLARARGESAGEPSRNRVDDRERGDLASR